MARSQSSLRRADAAVLVAVTVMSGAVLLLGDRFEPAGGSTVTQPVHGQGRIAACVADESMRLINPDRERCHSGEQELTAAATESPAAGAAR
jgi:hypothetical protein